jgi:hypothetical protein
MSSSVTFEWHSNSARQPARDLQHRLLELKADDIDVAAFGAFLDSDRHSNARLGAAEPAAADPLEIARACVPTLDLADAIERRHSRRSGWTVRLQKAWRVPRPASPLASPNTTLGN